MTSTTMRRETTVLPPDEKDRAGAEAFARVLLATPRGQGARLIGPGGEQVALPPAVFDVLVQVAETLASGKAITVAPLDTMLTTQQAADILGVSRPTLVRLLESGEISFEKPGLHRKVRLADLLDYQQRRRNERRSALAELTARDAADGLYEPKRQRGRRRAP